MDNNTKWIVRGYEFATEEETKTACLEYSKIKQIEKKIDYKNPQMVYQLYNKAVDGKIFKTIIGYEYLRKLQKYLLDKNADDVKVKPIPIAANNSGTPQETKQPAEPKTQNTIIKTASKNKEKTPFLVYCVVILAAMVVIMFTISMTGNRPTILNYERALQNKYAQWEQELQQRENAIKEKEKELRIQEE